jgi:ubiquitin C-terminal hydrolase
MYLFPLCTVFWSISCTDQSIFPIAVDMSPYVEEGAEGGKQTYCLSAIVSHKGSMSYGHYTAYVKTPEGWVYASDTDVRGATDAEVYGLRSTKSAYLMFYNRV